MRYPLAAGICLLFFMTAFAAQKKENTAAHAVSSAVPSNQPIAPEIMPAVSTSTAIAPVSLPGIETEQKPEIKTVPEEEKSKQHMIHRVWLWQESRECLWNLARKYYNDPWQWKKIYLANKYQIDNPNRIFPKQILIIPPREEAEK